MGRVESLRIQGVECWFNSQDHRPAHFHARRRGEWEVRVFFLLREEEMLEHVTKRFIGSRHRALLCKAAREKRAELLIEWERKVKYDE
jgi:hypothetical protein